MNSTPIFSNSSSLFEISGVPGVCCNLCHRPAFALLMPSSDSAAARHDRRCAQCIGLPWWPMVHQWHSTGLSYNMLRPCDNICQIVQEEAEHKRSLFDTRPIQPWTSYLLLVLPHTRAWACWLAARVQGPMQHRLSANAVFCKVDGGLHNCLSSPASG
jgi:hypothetical protein